MSSRLPESRRPPTAAVRRQLEKIVASQDFKAPKRLHGFLRYVVGEALAGRGDGINQYAIAVEVFGRDTRFDPSEDPIVRIEASKLRRALELYYLTAGRDDPVLVEIPKGSYQPRFAARTPTLASPAGTMPTLLVRTFEAKDDSLSGLAAAITEELVVGLTQLRGIRVLGDQPSKASASHVVVGRIRATDSGIRLTVHLLEAHGGVRLWADALDLPSEADAERLGLLLAVRIADLDGALNRHLSSGSNPAGIEDAEREFQRHLRTLAASSYECARATAEEALLSHPQSPELLAVLADIHRGGYAHGFTSDASAPALGLEFARRSVELGPHLPAARLALGYSRLHHGESDLAIEEAEAAAPDGSCSASIRGDAGVLMSLAGESERGLEWIDSAIRALESYPGWFRHPFFLAAYLDGDYQSAYEAARNIRMPGLLWDPLDRAAALGMLGEVERARRALAELQNLRPDFAHNPRRYIDCFVPCKKSANALLVGLGKAGLGAPLA